MSFYLSSIISASNTEIRSLDSFHSFDVTPSLSPSTSPTDNNWTSGSVIATLVASAYYPILFFYTLFLGLYFYRLDKKPR
jgi:hypothetical protein